jgi:orotate phosphoribosyltransferase-like protein
MTKPKVDRQIMTSMSKIVKYKLEEDTVALRKQGLSLQSIADELNATGKVPSDDIIQKWTVQRFLDDMPEIERQLISQNKKRLMTVVNQQMDIIHEVNDLYSTTKQLLDFMVEDALDKGHLPSATNFKFMSSELQGYLRIMMDIQKEINTYDNVKKFMQIVIECVKKNAPESLPDILEELKTLQGARWFADSFRK